MEEFFRGTPMNMNMNMMSAGRGGSSSEINNNVNHHHHHHHHLQVENDARRTRTRTRTSSAAAAGGGGGYHSGGAGGPAVIMGSTDHIHDPAGNMNMNIVQFETDQQEVLIKTQIINHPRYPDLVSAHIECQKVGAPREMKRLLEEIGRVSLSISTSSSSKSQIGADPQLDAFMEAYCGVLQQYKKELSKPVEEATAFLNNIEMQLSNLCGKQGPSHKTNSDFYPNSTDDGIGWSDEEVGYGDVEVTVAEGGTSGLRPCDRELKDMLLQKYSGYLTKLKTDFLKTRKKGKLPKTARCALMDWWETHYRWPYPTEEEKMQLSVATGLGQRQINNWFINQRKRHWKPSEDMKFALMENVNAINGGKDAGGGGPGVQFDTGTGFGNGDPM